MILFVLKLGSKVSFPEVTVYLFQCQPGLSFCLKPQLLNLFVECFLSMWPEKTLHDYFTPCLSHKHNMKKALTTEYLKKKYKTFDVTGPSSTSSFSFLITRKMYPVNIL